MDDDQGRHAFGYDDRYQLTTATHPLDPAESFAYDAAGNRLTSHLSATYRYNAANQLIEDAEFNYSFDADGNCTGKISKVNGERHEYIFNSENRMTGYRKYDVSGTVLVSADYFYDSIGRRMAKSVDGLLTRYLYQDEDIGMELAADGRIQRTYVHGPGIDEPLATWGADNRLYFYLTDALGTVRHIRDDNLSAFNLVATFNYDSFGQLLPSSSTGWNDAYRYTSRDWDPETGTYSLRARSYDSRIGRFISEDPREFVDKSLNRFVYVTNTPLMRVDPYGLTPKEYGTIDAAAKAGLKEYNPTSIESNWEIGFAVCSKKNKKGDCVYFNSIININISFTDLVRIPTCPSGSAFAASAHTHGRVGNAGFSGSDLPHPELQYVADPLGDVYKNDPSQQAGKQYTMLCQGCAK